jgi:hypothetical protein
MIQQDSWEAVKGFCLAQFRTTKDTVLESHPARELVEEFNDSMQIQLTPDMYRVNSLGAVIENQPAQTDSVRAAGSPTVRIYHIFEANLVSQPLIESILYNSARVTSENLREDAMKDEHLGGRGRANAILAMSLRDLKNHLNTIPPRKRGTQFLFKGEPLDGNVLAVFMEVDTPKYQGIVF